MPKYRQGKFKPRNPQKYKGNVREIYYRSGWELKMMVYLDKHPQVLEWSSEECVVPYQSPVDNKYHRYFPDFIVKFDLGGGKTEIKMIEIKPHKETIEPKRAKTVNKRYITEVMKWGVNSSKWEAAEEYCRNKGWKFQVLTEQHLFGKKP